MKRVVFGIIFCMIGIALIHQNKWLPGLIAFIAGFLLLMYRKRSD